MCGICGIVSPEITPQSKEIVSKMMATLSHRGPDDKGMIIEPPFVFGHARLAIIDIEHGKQPMQNDDGSLTLVYNGEIYNYIELRQELIRCGVKFKTFSDTEVLLRVFEHYGPDCLKKLNGMFAFAIYDSRKNQLFAARDHFGIKPFYYTLLKDGSFLFASEIKALFQHPACQPEQCREGLNEYLTFQFCLGNKTLFRDIYRLEPAHFLLLEPQTNKLTFHRYWEPSYEIDAYHTEDYFIDRLQILLNSSIEGQLRSDVPLGGYLSGGLDSSSVVTLAAASYGHGFQTFTGKFDEGPDYDESA